MYLKSIVLDHQKKKKYKKSPFTLKFGPSSYELYEYNRMRHSVETDADAKIIELIFLYYKLGYP